MNDRTQYVQRMKAKLDEWDAELAKLESKAKAATAEAKDQYTRQIQGLRKQRDEAMTKLKELQAAGEDAWEHLKTGVEKAWNALGEAVKSAASRLP